MRTDRPEVTGGGAGRGIGTVSTGMKKALNKVSSELTKRGINESPKLVKGSNKDLGKQARMRSGEVNSSNRQPRIGGHAN